MAGDGYRTALQRIAEARETDARVLSLACLHLESLPPEIAKLTGLQSLDLSHNGLTALPDWLGRLTTLEEGAVKNPRGGGLRIDGNPFPEVYAKLTAPGQPRATANVLAYLRGEIDEGRLGALPDLPDAGDPQAAADLLSELADKTRELQGRLSAADADPHVRRSVERLRDALAAQPLRPALLLSLSRSIEAAKRAFDPPEGRAELSRDAIHRIEDVLITLRDLLATYPVMRRIEAERIALDVRRDAEGLDAIETGIDAIPSSAGAATVPSAALFNDRSRATVPTMAAVSLDTLSIARKLTAAGFSRDQAEAVTNIIHDVRQADLSTLATKTDLREVELSLKADLREVELRMKFLIEAGKAETIKWVLSAIGFQALVIIGAIVALLKGVR